MLSATPETAGIAPLMTRLMAKDTSRHSAEEVAQLVESVGGKIGAGSGRNTIHVSAGVMRPDLDLAIDLVGDALLEPAFLENSVEREKGFQIASIKAEEDRPFTIAMQQLRESLFGAEHPYGLRSSGSPETVNALDRDALEALRQKNVCAQNGVIAVYGDIDASQAEDRLREKFESALPSGELLFADGKTGLGFPAINTEPITLHHEKEQAILLVGYRMPGIDAEDRHAIDLLDEACSDMASRVFIRIREELGLAYSVGASQILGLDTGLFLFYVATSPEQLDLVQTELLDEIDLLRRDGLEAEEFERAKSSFLGREIMSRQGAQQLAARSAVDELLGLGWDHFRSTPDAIRALTRETIQKTAANRFAPEGQVIVRLTRE
jgi:zinc protease